MPADLDRLPRECLAAGIGGAIADALYNPATVLQVRGQVAPQRSTWNLAIDAIRHRGFFGGLWLPGLTAICMRALTYSGTRVGLYPTVRDALPATGISAKLLAGCTTGMLGAFTFAPWEVLRVRIVAADGAAAYATTCTAAATIMKEDSVRGFWRGASPFALRAGIFSGVQLAVYDTFKGAARRAGAQEGLQLHLLASCISGLCAQIMCHPVDTVKTLVVIDASGARRGGLEVARVLIASGGMSRLYAGLLPALASRGPMVMTFLPLVEALRTHVFGLGNI